MAEPVLVEYLFVPGCPTEKTAPARLAQAAREAGVAVQVRRVPVTTEEEAGRRRFLGSPTFRIRGRDIEPEADHRTDFGLP